MSSLDSFLMSVGQVLGGARDAFGQPSAAAGMGFRTGGGNAVLMLVRSRFSQFRPVARQVSSRSEPVASRSIPFRPVSSRSSPFHPG